MILILAIATFMSFGFSQENGPKKNMKVMMKWQLTEYLDITEKQAEKFFPKMNDYDKKIKEINLQIKSLKEEVELNIEKGTSSRMENRSMLERIERMEKDKIELKTQYLLSLDGILEPVQLSKLMVFEKKFKKTLRDELKKRPRSSIRDVRDKSGFKGR